MADQIEKVEYNEYVLESCHFKVKHKMRKSYFDVSGTIWFLLIQHIYMTIAIKCFECGYLSILQQDNETMSQRSGCSHIYPWQYSDVDTCSYDTEVEFARGILQAALRQSLNDSLHAVCYSLRGTFRGDSIIIRGCDALPFFNPDENGRQCLQNSFKVWLETELGKEYITDHLICVCNNEDFCNYDDDSGGGHMAIMRSHWIFIFMFLSVFIYNYIH